jgi:hypothetical protein
VSSSSSSSSACTGIPDKFHPRKSFNFPKRTFGLKKEERSFRADWYEKYPWLHYDVNNDSAFCHLCVTADRQGKFLASTKRDAAFISVGGSLTGKKLPQHLVSTKQVIATKRQMKPSFCYLYRSRAT